ncbi:MAG: FecCD family ABC transporter permease [Desulfovibrio sp.]
MNASRKYNVSPRGTVVFWTLFLFLFSLLSLVLSCFIGPVEVSSAAVFSVLLERLTGGDIPAVISSVVADLRFSRGALSWLVGAGLALSGGVFQGLLRNPLADPFTLGVSTGAAFGASVALYLGLGGVVFLGLGMVPLMALLGAGLALVIVISLGQVGGVIRRETLVLAGIVVATFLSALISLVKSLDEEAVSSIVFWIMGSFQGRGWGHVALFAPYFVIGLVFVFRFCRELDIMALGDVQARQLGVNVSLVRLALLGGAGIITGAAVSVSGVIGFVGLVVPHLVRLVVGASHWRLLPLSAMGGGCLLLWSDVLARTMMPDGVELPVGVVTALIGGPFFCFLLRRKKVKGGI